MGNPEWSTLKGIRFFMELTCFKELYSEGVAGKGGVNKNKMGKQVTLVGEKAQLCFHVHHQKPVSMLI